MNGALRSNPDGPAPLNNIIASMPPLDKDIVVFRYIYNDQFLPKEIGSTFQSLGYFSTTMNPVLTASRVCFMKTRGSPVKDPTKEVVAVMRIHVMKGTRAIYIPGGEYELIFAHNIELQLVSYKTGLFVGWRMRLDDRQDVPEGRGLRIMQPNEDMLHSLLYRE